MRVATVKRPAKQDDKHEASQFHHAESPPGLSSCGLVGFEPLNFLGDWQQCFLGEWLSRTQAALRSRAADFFCPVSISGHSVRRVGRSQLDDKETACDS